MSADKYPCIFSRQMETIVYISHSSALCPGISISTGKLSMRVLVVCWDRQASHRLRLEIFLITLCD